MGNMKNCRKPGLRLDLRQENILILRNEKSNFNIFHCYPFIVFDVAKERHSYYGKMLVGLRFYDKAAAPAPRAPQGKQRKEPRPAGTRLRSCCP